MPQYEMTLARHDVQATPFHTFRRGVLWIRWWSWCLNCTLGLFMVPASAKQADLIPSGGLRSQHPHEHMVLLGHLRCPTPAFENCLWSTLSAQKLQATVSSSTPTALEAWDAVFQETSSQLVLLYLYILCFEFLRFLRSCSTRSCMGVQEFSKPADLQVATSVLCNMPSRSSH